jgi:hypothetical protein
MGWALPRSISVILIEGDPGSRGPVVLFRCPNQACGHVWPCNLDTSAATQEEGS